jgi:hypothetical protein
MARRGSDKRAGRGAGAPCGNVVRLDPAVGLALDVLLRAASLPQPRPRCESAERRGSAGWGTRPLHPTRPQVLAGAQLGWGTRPL